MLRHTCKCACILSSILYESVTITWRHVYAWLTHSLTHSHTYTHTHSLTHTHTHTHSHTHTHKYTHMHAHRHTDTHTHCVPTLTFWGPVEHSYPGSDHRLPRQSSGHTRCTWRPSELVVHTETTSCHGHHPLACWFSGCHGHHPLTSWFSGCHGHRQITCLFSGCHGHSQTAC